MRQSFSIVVLTLALAGCVADEPRPPVDPGPRHELAQLHGLDLRAPNQTTPAGSLFFVPTVATPAGAVVAVSLTIDPTVATDPGLGDFWSVLQAAPLVRPEDADKIRDWGVLYFSPAGHEHATHAPSGMFSGIMENTTIGLGSDAVPTPPRLAPNATTLIFPEHGEIVLVGVVRSTEPVPFAWLWDLQSPESEFVVSFRLTDFLARAGPQAVVPEVRATAEGFTYAWYAASAGVRTMDAQVDASNGPASRLLQVSSGLAVEEGWSAVRASAAPALYTWVEWSAQAQLHGESFSEGAALPRAAGLASSEGQPEVRWVHGGLAGADIAFSVNVTPGVVTPAGQSVGGAAVRYVHLGFGAPMTDLVGYEPWVR